MGFLKFLLAVGLVILGGIIMFISFFGGMASGIQSALFGGNAGAALFWIMGIVGFITFLGGVYMLRHH